MEVREYKGDVDLVTLIREWKSEGKTSEFGIKCFVPDILATLARLSVVLLLMEGETPVGFMGLNFVKSPLGPQMVGNEQFLYITPKFRGYFRKLITAAEFWTRAHGGSHLLINSSYMASGLCDKVSHIYELLKFVPFEKTFIKEVT